MYWVIPVYYMPYSLLAVIALHSMSKNSTVSLLERSGADLFELQEG